MSAAQVSLLRSRISLILACLAVAACSGSPELQKRLGEDRDRMIREFDEMRPLIGKAHLDLCQAALNKANSSPTLLVRYKLTSAFLPSKTLTCLAGLSIIARPAGDTSKFISYGAEITPESGLILKSTPNIFTCRFQLKDGQITLEKSDIVSTSSRNLLCDFPGDPVQIR